MRGIRSRINPAHEETRDSWPQSLWRDTNRRLHFSSPVVDLDADVLIVGAGFTGLWTAHHILGLEPSANVVIVDAVQPGFGASGRNGGWCSALLPMDLTDIADAHGAQAAVGLQEEMFATVDHVGEFVHGRAIDCGWAKGGSLTVATDGAQESRLRRQVTEALRFMGADDVMWLGTAELSDRIRVQGASGAMYTPHCAALNPYRLVDGLVQSLVEHGVRIFGATRAARFGKGFVELEGESGLVFATARQVVVATEAYAARARETRRRRAPLYSYVVATEPLPRSVLDEIGWQARETVADGRLMVTYAQLTADARIVFGGRGAPYKFASDIHSRHDTNARVHSAIEDTMHRLFPAASGVRISHRWGGPLGVPRDWHVGVHYDERTRAHHAGGYVGDGVALSHLTGRILAHRVTGRHGDILSLPLNDHRSRRWEPEPLRWAGINAGLALTKAQDAIESRTSRESRVLSAVSRLF
ncbi:MAG: NAD(P)/FAD-dependent oxidoreductase [Actinomycetota bacterium]